MGSNNKFVASFKLPICFHNVKGYDSHLTIDKAYLFGAKSLNILPMNAETCIISNKHFYILRIR